jgi:hypothetical protein
VKLKVTGATIASIAVLVTLSCHRGPIGGTNSPYRTGKQEEGIGPMGLSFALDSSVTECLTATGKDSTILGNLVLATVSMKFKKNLAECGCKSASLLFRSIERYQDFEMELASSVVRAPSANGTTTDVRVVLSADYSSGVTKGKGSLTLHMGCQPPD